MSQFWATVSLVTLAAIFLIPLLARAVTLEDAALSPSPVEHVALQAPGGPPKADPPKPKPTSTSDSTTTPRDSVPCGIPKGSWPNEKAMVEAEFGVGHIMVHVGYSESHFYPLAENCVSTASGIFQILDGTWRAYNCGPLTDKNKAAPNIRCARKIYDARGTKDWDASRSSWGKHLATATKVAPVAPSVVATVAQDSDKVPSWTPTPQDSVSKISDLTSM